MSNNNLSSIEELYTNNLEEFGISSKSVGWPNTEGHILRFEKLLGSFDFNNQFSLNDLGCGYGAILDYFVLKKLPINCYYGYDISQNMLDSLDISKYPMVTIAKHCSSRLSTLADFSVASGIFNVKFDESEDKWLAYIIKTIDIMNEFSVKGFSFNLLTSYVEFKKNHLYYGDPLFFFDYCKKNYSRYVSLIHDYRLWEWTIVVKK